MAETKNTVSKSRAQLRNMIYAALFLALAQVLPLVTANIPVIATMISPMHIPAFLCGFICGPVWGAVVGVVAPLLRFLIFGMPRIPMAVYMAFELCTYAVVAGILRRVLPKTVPFLYLSLVISMICGRIVYTIVFAIHTGTVTSPVGLLTLFGTQFVNTWAGIIIHLVIIPPIVLAVEQYRKKNK